MLEYKESQSQNMRDEKEENADREHMAESCCAEDNKSQPMFSSR